MGTVRGGSWFQENLTARDLLLDEGLVEQSRHVDAMTREVTNAHVALKDLTEPLVGFADPAHENKNDAHFNYYRPVPVVGLSTKTRNSRLVTFGWPLGRRLS